MKAVRKEDGWVGWKVEMKAALWDGEKVESKAVDLGGMLDNQWADTSVLIWVVQTEVH